MTNNTVIIQSNFDYKNDIQTVLFSIEKNSKTDTLLIENNINHNTKPYDDALIEELKDIKGFEGLYRVSNLGAVYSVKTDTLLKQKSNNKAYNKVSLRKNKKATQKYVHHLVAETFKNIKPNKEKKTVIDHIDNNKHNNRVDNLQLITQRLNSSKDKHQYNKTSVYTGAHFNKKANKFEAKIYVNGKHCHLGTFGEEQQAGIEYQKALNYYNENNNLDDYQFKMKRKVLNIAFVPDKNQITINF